MKITDRLHWFLHNLLRLPFILLWLPFAFLWAYILVFKAMLITNGSETLGFPWEQKWE